MVRRTRLKFDPPPTGLTSSAARMEVALSPQQDVTFTVSIACERDSTVRDSTARGVPHREMTVRPIPRFEEAREYLEWLSSGVKHEFRVEGDELVIVG